MIRINLLAGERRTDKVARGGLQRVQKVTALGSMLLVVTASGLGWRYWALSEQEASLGREIESARREEKRLAEILTQVQDFEARRQQLQQRVTLIDELRKGQSAPVHMIDQVSRALPDMLWLTSVKQEGYDITIVGRCLSLTALSDFVGNLESSQYFRRPVEILDSQVESSQDGGPDLISFSVRGTFQMSGIEVPPPGAPGRQPQKKGGRRG